jgi:predicted NBD/HSP70 family sugar kinase
MIRIGIDLGGTKIEVAALGTGGNALLRKRVASAALSYGDILDTVAALVHDAETSLGARGTIGIGTPGTVSRATGRIKNSNTACLNGQPLAADLQEKLGRPIRIANDANCFALSEAADGAAAGARVVFGVILGTGVGGGIVVDGHVLDGPNGIAGEWGHNPLPSPEEADLPAPACYCGRAGCIETYLSGPGWARPSRARRGRGGRRAGCAPHRRAGARRRRNMHAVARAVHRPLRARARVGRQRARPGRDRAGRRPVERRRAVHGGSAPLGTICVLGPRRHAPGAQPARRLFGRAGRGEVVAGGVIATAPGPAPASGGSARRTGAAPHRVLRRSVTGTARRDRSRGRPAPVP